VPAVTGVQTAARPSTGLDIKSTSAELVDQVLARSAPERAAVGDTFVLVPMNWFGPSAASALMAQGDMLDITDVAFGVRASF
jgi:hypothetical protein